LIALGLGSILLFVLSIIGVPWVVARLPPDYLTTTRRFGHGWHPHWRVTILIAKNLLGFVLLVAGIAMLVLPGQGVLSIVVALVLLDFPGKRRLERRVVSYPPLFRALNALRRRAGRPPLDLSAHAE
jgi:hypothetical protein